MMLWLTGARCAVCVATDPGAATAPFCIAGARSPAGAGAGWPDATLAAPPLLQALSSSAPDSRMMALPAVPRASVILVMLLGRAWATAGSALPAIIRIVILPRQPGRVAIVGGGVSGLAAAFLLKDAGLDVTVLEGSPRLGGKLAVSEVAGIAVDAGAESLLARRPEGTDLIAAAGLSDDLVLPGTTSAGIWTRGQIRPLPRRQFMGVPADLDELAATGIVSAAGLERAGLDRTLPAAPEPASDVSVATRIGSRFGAEVVDRVVEPLLGGVYAGRCEDLSFEATLPALAQSARGHRSLAAAVSAVLPPVPPRDS